VRAGNEKRTINGPTLPGGIPQTGLQDSVHFQSEARRRIRPDIFLVKLGFRFTFMISPASCRQCARNTRFHFLGAHRRLYTLETIEALDWRLCAARVPFLVEYYTAGERIILTGPPKGFPENCQPPGDPHNDYVNALHLFGLRYRAVCWRSLREEKDLLDNTL